MSQGEIKCPLEQGLGMLLVAAEAWQEVARTVHETARVPAGPRSVRAVHVKVKEQRLVSDAGCGCARRSEPATRLRRRLRRSGRVRARAYRSPPPAGSRGRALCRVVCSLRCAVSSSLCLIGSQEAS